MSGIVFFFLTENTFKDARGLSHKNEMNKGVFTCFVVWSAVVKSDCATSLVLPLNFKPLNLI